MIPAGRSLNDIVAQLRSLAVPSLDHFILDLEQFFEFDEAIIFFD